MGDQLGIFEEIDRQMKRGDYVPSPDPNAWRTGEEEVRLEPEDNAPPPGGLAEAAQAAGAEIKIVEIPGQESRLSRAVANVLPDLDPVVIKLREEVHKLLAYSQQRAVATIGDAGSATNDLTIMSELKKALDGKRKEYLKPLQDYQKSIRDVFDSISIPLEQANKVTKDKVLAFKREQERRRQEAEEAARLQREADAAARKVLEETGEIIGGQSEAPVVIPDAVSTQVHADLGTSGVTKTWRFEVTDFTEVPDKYKVPNDVAILKVIRAGGDIPGIKAWQEEGLRVTTKKES